MDNTTWAKGLHAWAQQASLLASVPKLTRDLCTHAVAAIQVVALPNGTFVMVFPAMDVSASDPRGGVGVASASHPAGPFSQASADRLPGTAGADDPTIFLDEFAGPVVCINGGSSNPYNGSAALCGVLNDDMVGWEVEPGLLTGMSADWHYFEAPWLMRHNNTYFLSYMMEYKDCPGSDGRRIPNPNCSWSHGGFDIGFSTAAVPTPGPSSLQRSTSDRGHRSPGRTGPLAAKWTPRGTLMWSNNFGISGGNNHQGIVEFPADSGEFYMFYHSAWLSGNGLRRNVGVDRLYFNASDPVKPLLSVTATPNWLRAAVEYLSPYRPVPAFTMAQASDKVFTRESGDSGPESAAEMCGNGAKQLCVDGLMDGDWLLVRQVDFGARDGDVANSGNPPAPSAIMSLRVNVPSCSSGDCPRLTIHMDTLDSPALTICVINGTNSEWQTAVCPLDSSAVGGLTGVHNLWFEFEGGECVNTLLAFAWWQVTLSSAGQSPIHTTPTPLAKAAIRLTMESLSTSASVSVRPTASGISCLVAQAGLAAATIVLHDNEDGTWQMAVESNKTALGFACASTTNGVIVLRVISTPNAPCTRMRLQVTAGGVYALRFTEIGLWVSVDQEERLVVDALDPLLGNATLFSLNTDVGIPPH